MAQSPMHWESHQPSSQLVGVLGSSVLLPLRLLGLSNRGSPRGDGLMMLRQETHDSNLTVADLISNRKKYTGFVKSGVGVRDSHLILCFRKLCLYIYHGFGGL